MIKELLRENHHIIYPRDFNCNDMKKLSAESKRK